MPLEVGLSSCVFGVGFDEEWIPRLSDYGDCEYAVPDCRHGVVAVRMTESWGRLLLLARWREEKKRFRSFHLSVSLSRRFSPPNSISVPLSRSGQLSKRAQLEPTRIVELHLPVSN